MAYTIKNVLDEVPAGRQRGEGRAKVDYSAEIDLINQIPEGKVLQVELPEGLTYRKFSSAIRAAGRTINYTIDPTLHRGDVYLSKSEGVTPRAPRTRKVVTEAVEGAEGTEAPAESGRRGRTRELEPALA